MFSSLIAGTLPHHDKFSSRGGRAVSRVLPHHWAGTGTSGRDRLTNPSQKASANYIIMNGKIYGQVPEEYRAWTSGSHDVDAVSITLEIQNESGRVANNDNASGSWRISEANLIAAARLIADIGKRYNWGDMADSRIRFHREFAATACPGGYLWGTRAKFKTRCRSAYNAAVGKKETPGTSVNPSTPSTKSDWVLADEVLAGVHGSGDARKKSLGSRYAAVQKIVNQRLGSTSTAPSKKSIAQLADEVLAGVHGSGDARKKSLGSQYDAVQKEVNRRLQTSKKQPKSISQLADEVLRGQHGNGDARKKSLGSQYAAVQAEINRRLK